MGLYLYLKSQNLISQKLQDMYAWSQCGEAVLCACIPVGLMQNSV